MHQEKSGGVTPDFSYSDIDGFVKSPISALRFISLSLRRTGSTPRDTRFARLELGAFYFAIGFKTFHEFINIYLISFRLTTF